MLCPPFRHPVSDSTDIFPPAQGIHPCYIPWILDVQILQLTQLPQQPLSHQIPRNEGEISERALVTDEPPSAILPQTEIEDADHTLNFIRVSLNGRRDFLWMETGEPSRLAVIWPLSCALPSACVCWKTLPMLT